jgi:hypothetical protein
VEEEKERWKQKKEGTRTKGGEGELKARKLLLKQIKQASQGQPRIVISSHHNSKAYHI